MKILAAIIIATAMLLKGISFAKRKTDPEISTKFLVGGLTLTSIGVLILILS